MAVGGKVGEASVEIRPDLSRFNAELSAGLRSVIGRVDPNATVLGQRLITDVTDVVRRSGRDLDRNLAAALATVHPDAEPVGADVVADITSQLRSATPELDRNLAAALAGVSPDAIPIGQDVVADIADVVRRGSAEIDTSLSAALAGVDPNGSAVGLRLVEDIGDAVLRSGDNIDRNLAAALAAVDPNVSSLGDDIADELGRSMLLAGPEIERGLNVALAGVNPNTAPLAARITGETAGGGFLSGLAGGLATVGKVGTLAFAAIGIAAGAAIGFGTKIASDNEQAQISFTTLLGSAERAGAFYRELQNFAAKTPFEIAGLRESAAQFLGAGVEAGRVIPILTAVGDATSAVGTGEEGIQRAVRALGQMQTKGKVTTEELLQLQEAGVPAMKVLAAAMGVDVVTAQEKVSAGQVQVNTLFDAIQGYAGPLGQVKGLMDAQAGSLKGLLSTFKDVISQGFGKVGETVVPQLKAQLPQLTTVISTTLENLTPGLAEIARNVVGVFATILPGVAQLVVTVGSAFSQLVSVIAPVIARLAPILSLLFEDILAAAFPIVQALARVFQTSLIPALKPILEIFGRLLVAVGPLIARFVDLAGTVIGTLLKALTPLLDVIVGVAEEVITALMPVFDELEPVIAEAGKAVAELAIALVPLIPALGDVLIALIPLLPSFVKLATLWTKLLPILTPLIALLARFLAAVVSLAAGPLGLLARGVETAVDAVGHFLSHLEILLPPLKAIGGAFATFGTTVARVFVSALAPVGRFFATIGSALATAASAVGRFVGAIAGPIASAVEIVLTLMNPFQLVGLAIGALLGVVIEKLTPVVDFIAGVVARITDIISTGFNLYLAIVTTVLGAISKTISTVWGVISGTIGDKLDSIGRKVREVWDAVYEKVRDTVATVFKTVATVFETIRSTIASVLERIFAAWSAIWGGIQRVFGTAVATLLRFVASLAGGFLTGIGAVLGVLSKLPGEIGDKFGAAKTAVDGFKGIIETSLREAAAVAEGQGAEAGRKGAEGLGRGVLSGDALVRGTGVSLGHAVGEGMARGIAERQELAWAAAQGMGLTALERLAAALRPGSPSKETMKIGRFFTEGFAVGITAQTGEVVGAASTLAGEALNGIGSLEPVGRDLMGTLAEGIASGASAPLAELVRFADQAARLQLAALQVPPLSVSTAAAGRLGPITAPLPAGAQSPFTLGPTGDTFGDIVIQNPAPERASDSVPIALRKLQYLRGR